jgi:putative ABC transport system substrate-binding protein
MNRRNLITLIGGAAAWPVAGRAQQGAVPVVGYLSVGSPTSSAGSVTAFRDGLREAGFVEGQNVAIEYRWMEAEDDRLTASVAELVRRPVAVIATGPTAAALAAKRATSMIPIVFIIGGDPVKFGLANCLSRPGRNATGINVLATELEGKRLGLLHDLALDAGLIAALVNPTNSSAETQVQGVEEAARVLGRRLLIVTASNDREIEAAFSKLAQQGVGALNVTGDAFFIGRRSLIVASAARLAIPTMYQLRQFADVGGLISYGDKRADAWRQVGVYTGRILKGEKPADLPILQPTKFELVINLGTAKALGLTIPPSLLAVADEVIE